MKNNTTTTSVKAKKKPSEFYQTKSRFVDTYGCSKKLWMYKNMPNIAKEYCLSDTLNMEQGTRVGVVATTLYAGGVLVDEKVNAIANKKTMDLLMSGVKYIFEATFIFADLLVKVDILERNDDGSYNIIEVKSSNSIKDSHKIDAAFQKYVVELTGLTVHKVYLKHMNPQYVRGERIDKTQLFKKNDVTEEIQELYNAIPEKLKENDAILASKVEPKCDIGSFCKYPHKCPFYDHCHKEINKDSVTKLARLSADARAILKEMNVKYIKDIPEEVLTKVRPTAKKKKDENAVEVKKELYLTANQKIQVIAAKNENKLILNVEKIKEVLINKLVYPLYHLDFEATNKAIPLFKGAKPNQFFVYQFSVDVEPLKGKTVHHEYLHLKKNDPRREVAERLIKACGSVGSVTVWNQSFEESRIMEMANELPDLKDQLVAIVKRMVDLEDIFKGKHLYHHNLQGSSSIKYVLPFMCPDLDYSRLAINNGSDSQAKYTYLMENRFKKKESKKVIAQLLEYNNLDTLAMLRVLRKIKAIMKKSLTVSEEVMIVN